MKIRRAVSGDYKKLMALYDAFMKVDRYTGLDSDSFEKVLGNKNSFVLVAEDRSRLVGFITASTRLVIRYPQPIMEVDELYVDPDFREHGVGRQLIQAVEVIVKESNLHRIYIESGYEYKIAHKFYQKNGYTKQGYYFKKVL
jgi:PhnO protein